MTNTNRDVQFYCERCAVIGLHIFSYAARGYVTFRHLKCGVARTVFPGLILDAHLQRVMENGNHENNLPMVR